MQRLNISSRMALGSLGTNGQWPGAMRGGQFQPRAARAGRAFEYVLLCFWWVGAKLGRFFLVPPTLLAARAWYARQTATVYDGSEAVG